MQENETVKDRLDSWKDIASHLRRDVRTVIRWEKEKALPVHRVRGGKRQAIFAYKHELDAWLEEGDSAVQTATPVQIATPETAAATSMAAKEEELPTLQAIPDPGHKNSAVPAKRRFKWILLAVGVCIVSLIWVFSFFPRTPAAVRIARFEPLTDDGRTKAGIRTDGRTLYFNEFEVNRPILAASSIGGGPVRQIDTPFSNVDLQDVSNDGQNLLVSSFEGIEWERRLWIMPVQGGTPRPVGDTLCHYARWSPDNRRIACITGTTIMLIDPDGSNPRTVGSFSLPPSGLTWAPGGEQLRFSLNDIATRIGSPWEMAIHKDGSVGAAVLSKVLSDQKSVETWAWTQNDKNFVYAKRQPDGKMALFVKQKNRWLSGWGREGELPIQVRSIEGVIPGSTGNVIYLLVGNANRGELLKFDSQKKAFPTFLHGLSSAVFLSFSKDGQWITYQSTLDYSLWRCRADGTNPVQLTKSPMSVEFSSWSPDGRQIAFMGQLPGKPWRIYLIGRDGGTPEEAAPGKDGQGVPTWSPDGQALAYGNVMCEETQSCWIRRLDLATRKVDTLPDSRGFRTARWSPDGKYIAALQNEAHRLMLFDVKQRRWTMLADSITGDNITWSSDSQSIYADSPQGQRPIIERIRIKDRQRTTAVNLAPLHDISGRMEFWFGLTPDDSIIFLHTLIGSEIYVLEWTDQ
ncbi:MAG TPA: hypothetical protein VG488_00460 [Candidatus Angelobacter sp.]|nr:hypothetical protein [Candidatus Angelobacter sp.]